MLNTPKSVVDILKVCLQSGSPADWESFIFATRATITGAVARSLRQWIVPGFDLLEDLTQEVYLRLCADGFAALKNFRSDRPEALIAYLKVVSSSVAIDYLRANGAQKRGSGRVGEWIETLGNAISAEIPRGSALEHQTILMDVDRCLRARKDLPDRDRWIFWMYYRHGLTTKAIAEIASVELSQKGVESAILRLTRQVRECFGTQKIGIGVKAEGKGA